jgi:acetolactate synthase-1/2/3 large subunit
MTLQELGTIMQHRIPVLIIILNNRFLGMVRQWQQLFFESRYSFTELTNPDFVALASAYDIPASRITSRSELAPAISRMLNSNTACLLEVWVQKEENVFPMVPSGAGVADMLLEPPVAISKS